MPPLVKATSSNAISVRVSIDRLVLGSIPDIGFAGDAGLHGPKRYNWHQLVGSFKYTLWRLQERVVGQGARRAAGAGDAQPDRTRSAMVAPAAATAAARTDAREPPR